jgi:hypothetical protein
VPENQAFDFLQQLKSSSKTGYPSMGLGEDIRLEGQHGLGSALIFEDRLVVLPKNLVAFDL